MTNLRSTFRLGGIAVVTLSLAAALAGCTPTPESSATGENTTNTAAFEHIHGLGADPSTGTTYAGTHQGVWQIPTGLLPDSYLAGAPNDGRTQASASDGPAFDAMGFTVAAPGLLLASGHPGADESTLSAPNVGLISSTDAATTWSNLSLAGTTDFHDLDAVALPSGVLRVYGYDAADGTVSISDDDGATWSSGAAVGLRDLAADPANPDQVFATTESGLVRSDDAGRTFLPVPGAPMLYLIDVQDAAAGGGVVGIGPEGVVWHQDAEGEIWTRGGQTEGSPEALGFVGGSAPWLLAADRRGVVASDDFGLTWTVLVATQA
ncbi:MULTISPECIES: F510_1955 family glycosylhydrolase [Cryobacterium]|uniref:Exo-alpha-sialidase n=1 Tax=Cryobacterium breve TaxID=1259258 RepID=A0ABY2IWA2_9MICO|nr:MULTISPECIES: hypothetical protein [Cryobacterium]TFC93097.1 hypothetical protein E3T20_10765 [Cryobacterium sp. TmT3-12]TFC96082.1 hypothetical protein E3O65_13635 [Cryobacterium breve]